MLTSLKSNRITHTILSENLAKIFIYLGFGYVMWMRHVPLEYVSDDAVVSSMIGGYSLLEYFNYLIYFNGRVITDCFANFWYRMGLLDWKCFDTVVYVFAAILFSRIFTKNKWYHALTSCVLISYFPMFYLHSAGYIASSTNYFYPVVAILCILYFIKYLLSDKKAPLFMYPLAMLGIIYATNHDQTGIALLVGLLCLLIYCKITKVEKRIFIQLIGLFLFSLIMYTIYFLLPGHLGRMSGASISELYWFPDFANWTLFDKIYHGYSTTAANLIYNKVTLFIVFSAVLLISSIRQKCPLKMFIGFVPLAGSIFSNYLGGSQFISFPPLSYGMTEMMEMKWFILPFLLSVCVVICVFLGVWFNVQNEKKRLLIILLLLLGAGTRLMMGFTPTIYASSYRTFTFFMYTLIAANLLILDDIEDNIQHKHLLYMAIAAIFSFSTL